MIERIEVQCNRYKMKINTEKTKSMKIGRYTEVIDLRIGDNTIEQVDEFKSRSKLHSAGRNGETYTRKIILRI